SCATTTGSVGRRGRSARSASGSGSAPSACVRSRRRRSRGSARPPRWDTRFLDGGRERPTVGCKTPDIALAPTDDPLAFRELLAAEPAWAGMPEAGTIDLLVAAGEVFENARTHGGGLRVLRAGLADGPGLADPLAGYLPHARPARRRALD